MSMPPAQILHRERSGGRENRRSWRGFAPTRHLWRGFAPMLGDAGGAGGGGVVTSVTSVNVVATQLDEVGTALVDAAGALLANEGPGALTVRRIASEAGVSTMN